MNDEVFAAFVIAAEDYVGGELQIEWDGELDEVTVYTPLAVMMRHAIEAIGAEMGVRVTWE